MTIEEQNELIVNNMAIVTKIIKSRFSLGEDEWDDLFQEGCLGLVYAARHFNPDLGFKFSTYAYSIVTGYLQIYKRTKAMHLHGVHIPRTMMNDIASNTTYAIENGLDISSDDDVKRMTKATGKPFYKLVISSINNTIKTSDSEDTEYGNIISSDENSYEDVEIRLYAEQLLEYLQRRLNTTDYLIINDAILTLINHQYELTQMQLSIRHNVTQATVSRVFKKTRQIITEYMRRDEQCH